MFIAIPSLVRSSAPFRKYLMAYKMIGSFFHLHALSTIKNILASVRIAGSPGELFPVSIPWGRA